ncbi:Clan MG, family M24, aminopeptidase P-like metallopeptidase [Tritrichomonas foetus]|uniref:Clan MG, family M24, aminopeptidase P-like metallopeptidase n=1 Tax=Tritrichomonas foetus TaxID=1144522 RepID=A0A1J4KSR5_9EUKA|nr:Clan MG, family M24, aminopeptidase P-like metallopeptidase [Tritrichomonas foetus]|eukprot:OHT12517.1 Clan MG, family M24, aminopeptidase P-like metallopeptidase [Tritrichomonas foetus]
MNGICFRQHRDRIISILKFGGLENSLIYMPSPSEPKELFTESDLPFVQEGIFFWLTGWERPSSSIIIDVKNNRSILITPAYDEEYETWHGKAPSNGEIIDQTGVDEVLQGANARDQLHHLQKKLKPKHRLLAFKLSPQLPIDDIGTLVCAVSIARRTKFDHEIEMLRKAAGVSSKALIEVMKFCQPEIPECNLEAAFLFYGTLFGGRGLSFPTIAASGWHGAYLHYTENKDIAHNGDMVLFDCGLYVDHYAGDITRTFPVNGKFSEVQKLVYNALLKAQCSMIESVRPGITLYELDSQLFNHIFEILKLIGIVNDTCPFSIEIAQLFCPHSISHHIGVSVHDWSYYDGKCLLNYNPMEAFTLEKNMIISIEPGIYFNSISLQRSKGKREYSAVNFDRAFEFAKTVCAIRIEDDVLVTSTGHEVLTSFCPKTTEEIEAIMAQ